ncbi:MAG: LPXTG cell wall anchor domain-containing protein, partial [Oscillospiraceae bacterium]|nr:LPXTG cell wall anchor domain-containing protein [Oscillospiraceae bacterium]
GEVLEEGKEIPVIVEDDKTEDDKTEGDNTTGGEGTDNDNAGAGSEDDGTTAPETGDSASVLVAVLAFLMAGAVVVLAKKRA